MQLKTIELIESKLDQIREAVRLDDAYYINDTIVTGIEDPDMPELVHALLVNYGYEEEKIEEVMAIIAELIEAGQEQEVEE